MRQLFALCALFLVGCGQGFQVKNPVYHDPKLLALADKVYHKLYELGSNPIPIENISLIILDYDSNNVYAYCSTSSNGDRAIYFYQKTLTYNSELALEGIMLHELGHCALNLDHDDTMIDAPNNPGYLMPKSIMHTYFHSWWWVQYVEYYYQQIVGR